MASPTFSSIDDALSYLNSGRHDIRTTEVSLNVNGRWVNFRKIGESVFGSKWYEER